MTAPIEDVSNLPGKKVSDQEGTSIGKVKEIYATGEDGQPTWVEIEGSFGTREKRSVLIPLARLKDEDGSIGVPYSKNRIGDCPDVDTSDGISPRRSRAARLLRHRRRRSGAAQRQQVLRHARGRRAGRVQPRRGRRPARDPGRGQAH